MSRLLRLAAIAALLGGLAVLAGSLPWRAWFGRRELTMLPEGQTDFVLGPPWAVWAMNLLPVVLLLANAVAVALALLALAGIVDRLESIRQGPLGHGDPAPSGPPSVAGSKSFGKRLASPRRLRIAAASVAAATLATAAAHYLLWLALWRNSSLHDTYYVSISVGGVVGFLVLEGVAVLLLIALARALDRLDDVQIRIGQDD